MNDDDLARENESLRERISTLSAASLRVGDGERGIAGGLGLAICKGLVEAQGGRIRAESAGVGRGTRFTFTIPVAGATRSRRRATRRSPPASIRSSRPSSTRSSPRWSCST